MLRFRPCCANSICFHINSCHRQFSPEQSAGFGAQNVAFWQLKMDFVNRSSGHSLRAPEKKPAKTRAPAPSQNTVENEAVFQTSGGKELRAQLARLTRHAATFE